MEEEMARLRRQDPQKEARDETDFFKGIFSEMVQSFKSMAESGQSAASAARERHEDAHDPGERGGRRSVTLDKINEGDARQEAYEMNLRITSI